MQAACHKPFRDPAAPPQNDTPATLSRGCFALPVTLRTTSLEKFLIDLFSKRSQGLGAAPQVAPAGAKSSCTPFSFAKQICSSFCGYLLKKRTETVFHIPPTDRQTRFCHRKSRRAVVRLLGRSVFRGDKSSASSLLRPRLICRESPSDR